MLHQTAPRRERILLIGAPGSSKSWSWRSIAQALASTEAPGRLYVADTDLAWEGQRPPDGSLDDRVTPHDVFEWDDFMGVVKEARAKYQEGDWLVVDMVNRAWDYAQQYYFEQVYGKDIEDYWMDARHKGENIGGEYGSNWAVINKVYDRLMLEIAQYPGHVLACTPVTEVRQPNRSGEGGDDRDTIRLYGKFGVKPAGQKYLSHNFHTVLLLQEVPRAGWVFSTVKDRNREPYNGEPLEDFVKSYLMKVGGWRL